MPLLCLNVYLLVTFTLCDVYTNKYGQKYCISNIIMKLTEVRAILNWKYEPNGDGLIDVAALLLVFQDIGSYRVADQRIVYPGKHDATLLRWPSLT